MLLFSTTKGVLVVVRTSIPLKKASAAMVISKLSETIGVLEITARFDGWRRLQLY